MKAGRVLPGVALAATVLLLDQATKTLANALLVLCSDGTVALAPFLDLCLGYNRGVSFGLLANDHPAAPWVLAAVAGFVAIVLFVWMLRAGSGWERGAFGLIIGGALGNTTDRLRQGMVTDFIDLHAAGWHWPAFNLADSAIVLGAAILVGRSFLTARQPANDAAGPVS
jgi:signal peptidase II